MRLAMSKCYILVVNRECFTPLSIIEVPKKVLYIYTYFIREALYQRLPGISKQKKSRYE